MKVVGIIIFVALALFVTWLVIDTTIYVIKKVKEKKIKKLRGGTRLDNGTVDEEVNNATDTK